MEGLHRRYGGSGTIQLYMTGMLLWGEWDYSVVHDRNEQKSMKQVTKIVGAKYNSGVNRSLIRMENGMVQ